MRQRRAGTRRHFVELQRVTDRTTTPDGYQDVWTTYARVWAAVEPTAASHAQRPIANTTQTPISHLVEIDYRADVQLTHRVRLNGTRALFVQGWQNVDERNKTLVLACEERPA